MEAERHPRKRFSKSWCYQGSLDLVRTLAAVATAEEAEEEYE